MFKYAPIILLATLTGCTSHIVPLREVTRVEEWVPDTAATAPATAPNSQPATTSAPATQPGRMIVKVIDPNESSRFIYNASYDNIWKQATTILTDAGFTLDRQDYRLGVITTFPLASAQVVEFWKPQHANITDSLENTINSQHRYIRLTIANVETKPNFYQIGIQVLVERQTNPTEAIGGPIFVEGSGFGRNALTLRSDYSSPQSENARWATIGHDPDLERKLLNALFNRI